MCVMFVLICILSIYLLCVFFFFKQKTAYEMRISDWSSDVCSSDLILCGNRRKQVAAKLGVSLQTVDLYKNALFNKVKVRNAACLIRYAVQSGWMSVEQIMVQGITCARTRAGRRCASSSLPRVVGTRAHSN